jgi:regulator of sirC expression with transglutaminase-like and TPR domain
MDLDAALHRLADDPAACIDVAEVALRLAADEHTGLDVEGYLSELDGMAHEARRYVSGNLSAQLNGLCRYLFHEMGFHGNTQEYDDPRNSYLNDVLDRRTGLPITLSVVAMAIGSRAGLEVVGVGLPGHFIAKAVSGGAEALFDPFHGGRRLTTEECAQLVEQTTGRPFRAAASALQATPAGPIVQRLLNNLKALYSGANDYPRVVRIIERLRQIAPSDISLRRELGTTLLQAGQPGRAIDHLDAYLADAPPGGAVEARQLLDRARAQVARWN